MKRVDANIEDIAGYLNDCYFSTDEIFLRDLSEEILTTPIQQGYVANTNFLQWKLASNFTGTTFGTFQLSYFK
jgi:hypothetical protein